MLRLLPLLAPLATATDLEAGSKATDLTRPEVRRSTTGVSPGNPKKKQDGVGCFGAESRSTFTLADLNGHSQIIVTSEPNCTVAEVKDIAVERYNRNKFPNDVFLDRAEVQIIDITDSRVLTDDDRVDDTHQFRLAFTKKETTTFMQGALSSKIEDVKKTRRGIRRGSMAACGAGLASICMGSCIVIHAVTDPKKGIAAIVGSICAGHLVSKTGCTVAGGNLALNAGREHFAKQRQENFQRQQNLYAADQGRAFDDARSVPAAAAAQPSVPRTGSTSLGLSKPPHRGGGLNTQAK